MGYTDGPLPSDAADKQMLSTDVQIVADRHDEVASKVESADALLERAQRALPPRKGGGGGDGGGDDDDDEREGHRRAVREARGLYDEALRRAPRDVRALASRAACAMLLGELHASIADCTAALDELDAEEERAREIAIEFTGMFAMPPVPAELTKQTEELAASAPTLRFELLKRRAAARVEQGEAHYPQASVDLKSALRLRPAEPSVVVALDSLARKAAEAGVELEPLPPVLPPATGLAQNDDDDAADGEESDGDEAAAGAEADGGASAAAEAAEAGGSGGAAAAAPAPSSKPPVGTRSAAQLKSDADAAFREARLGRAVSLYTKALKADAAAEWMGSGGGILFRCQCLANRSACHLKLGSYTETVDDAGAAIAALGTGLVGADQQSDADALLLKLLARRGMALCQLTRYDDAAADYARAVDMDPENAQLAHDLKLIEAARS